MFRIQPKRPILSWFIFKFRCYLTGTISDATVSAEADLKYKEEMKKFENKKVLLKLEMAQVACIVSEVLNIF